MAHRKIGHYNNSQDVGGLSRKLEEILALEGPVIYQNNQNKSISLGFSGLLVKIVGKPKK